MLLVQANLIAQHGHQVEDAANTINNFTDRVNISTFSVNRFHSQMIIPTLVNSLYDQVT